MDSQEGETESLSLLPNAQPLNDPETVKHDFYKVNPSSTDSIVTISPRELGAKGSCPIVGHYVSGHTIISCPDLTYLAPFLCVAGNCYRHFCFIGIGFKNPIIVYKPFGSNRLKIPPETCVLVEASTDTLYLEIAEPTFLFTYRFHTTPSEMSLLETLFPPKIFITKAADIRTLYAITAYNPFKAIWTQTRKNSAYQSLVKLFNSCVLHNGDFTIEVASTLRHFRRNLIRIENLNTFSSWWPLAFNMAKLSMKVCFDKQPSADFGKELTRILNRTHRHQISNKHPPEDFYLCQITLSDTEPVGIACRIVDCKVEYVSVMVLSFTKELFMDSNNITCCFDKRSPDVVMCSHWFPLFKNKDTWKSFGLQWYTRKLLENAKNLIFVIDWLSVQTALPYRYMKTDLMQVFEILTGKVKPRWS